MLPRWVPNIVKISLLKYHEVQVMFLIVWKCTIDSRISRTKRKHIFDSFWIFTSSHQVFVYLSETCRLPIFRQIWCSYVELKVQYLLIRVYRSGRFERPAPSQRWEIIENTNAIWNTFSTTGVEQVGLFEDVCVINRHLGHLLAISPATFCEILLLIHIVHVDTCFSYASRHSVRPLNRLM